MKPKAKIVLTNRDHVRDAELFRTRCGARVVADADEVTQLATIAIDEAVREGDLIAGALRVIHLPGKSAGEIGLYFDPAHHAVSREMGGILLLGDAIWQADRPIIRRPISSCSVSTILGRSAPV
jgi:glyoxylase-like metal-dependent hydrolase (beta-lactamase superfamily II)